MKQMRKIAIQFIALFCLAVVQVGYAEDAMQNINKPLSIVIVPFVNETANADDGLVNSKIDEIIQHDLQNSGRFQIANNQRFAQAPSNPMDIDLNYWQQFHLNAMVVGKVRSLGGDQYQVTFSLVNLPEKSMNPIQQVATQVQPIQPKLPSNQIDNLNPTDDAPVAVAPQPVVAAPSVESSSTLITQTLTLSKQNERYIAHSIANKIYQKLTNEPGIFTSKIAYVMTLPQDDQKVQLTQYKLQVADYDGHEAKTLFSSVDPIMSPAWSPDGKELAFVSFDNKGYPAIYTIAVNGGTHKLLSAVTGLNAAPAFSPDAQKLALVLSKTGNPKVNLLSLSSKVFSQVTTGWSADTEPSWTPDGNNLVFTSNRGGSPQIYELNFTSQAVNQLTSIGGYNANPMVSADGKWLVMIHGEGRAFNVAMQSLNEASTLKLLTNNGLVSSLTIAPDSNLVMYSTFNKGHEILAVTSINGAVSFNLASNPLANLKEPTWGPIPTSA